MNNVIHFADTEERRERLQERAALSVELERIRASAEFAESDKAATPLKRFRVIRYDELKARPPLQWLIKGTLPQAELCVMYGEPGSGKSFLAFDMACAIERGKPWGFSKLAVRQGRTFYVFSEGGNGARARYDAYAQRHGDGPLPGAIFDAPNLLNDDDGKVIAEQVKADGGADLIIIDTLSASLPGGDENTGRDMSRAVDQCKLIHRETGALVMLVHHSGKDASKGARGWSGLKAAADAELELTRNGDLRNVTVSKMKDGADGARFSFKLETVTLGLDDDGDDITSCVVLHVESQKAKPENGPTGLYVDPVRQSLNELGWFNGEAIHMQSLIDLAKQKLPAPEAGKKDCRAGNLRHSGVMKLIKAGELELTQDGNAVRKRGAVIVSDGEWDDE